MVMIFGCNTYKGTAETFLTTWQNNGAEAASKLLTPRFRESHNTPFKVSMGWVNLTGPEAFLNQFNKKGEGEFAIIELDFSKAFVSKDTGLYSNTGERWTHHTVQLIHMTYKFNNGEKWIYRENFNHKITIDEKDGAILEYE